MTSKTLAEKLTHVLLSLGTPDAAPARSKNYLTSSCTAAVKERSASSPKQGRRAEENTRERDSEKGAGVFRMITPSRTVMGSVAMRRIGGLIACVVLGSGSLASGALAQGTQ